jgi:hypothetical protein
MWWDGSEYTDEDPWVYNEEIGTVG